VDFVQNNFSQNHRLFSFPFTDYQVSDQFFKIVREKQIAEITFGSAGLKHDPAEMNFQRIPMEVGTLTAENILAGEYLYHILKKPLGKNLISRHD